MDDLDLLQKAARDNPREDVPLLMFADELRARGEGRAAAEAESVVAVRNAICEAEVALAQLAAAKRPAAQIVDEAVTAFREHVAALLQARHRDDE